MEPARCSAWLGVSSRLVIRHLEGKAESGIADGLLCCTKESKSPLVGSVLESDGNLNGAPVGRWVCVANLARLKEIEIIVKLVLERDQACIVTVEGEMIGNGQNDVPIGFAGADDIDDFALFDAH